MAINGQQIVNVGLQNQVSGSDTLFDAFTKINNNFDTLFQQASPDYTFVASTGINTQVTGNIVTIKNTGVNKVIPGSGIVIDQIDGNGNVIISVAGDANGNIIAGVSRVGVNSTSLNVVGSPVISAGNITINLPDTGVTSGTYIAPTLTIDRYGRITSANSIVSIGTVTSVQVTGGTGIAVTGSPVTSNGEIVITNTGVTRLNAGLGITLSGGTGNVTISGASPTIDFTSNSLAVVSTPGSLSLTTNLELPIYGCTTNIAANGITSGNARALTTLLNIVATSTASDNGVKLPVVPSGQSVKIVNTSANIVSVYPPTSHSINNLSVNEGYGISGNARIEFAYAGANKWYSM